MAKRRMLSHRIISSAHFLKMPVSSQALYFHLCVNADDDGIVEAWPIMQLGGFAEDDIKVLASKEFVKILNEDLVTFVLDWREHNLIRADHKVDSMYKDLLLRVVPEVDLVVPEPRSDVRDNSRRLSHGITGQSTDSPRTSDGLIRLGKDSQDKVSQDKIEDGTHTPSQIAKDFFDRGKRYTECFEALSAKVSKEVLEIELNKFILYWTEPNKSGTKVRWQQEPTFEIRRRIVTWLNRVKDRQTGGKAKQIIY